MKRMSALTVAASIALLLPAGFAHAAIVITNPANITLANMQSESGGDTSDNPNVVSVPSGLLVPYAASNSTGVCCGGTYDLSNINDGDIGTGVLSDGTYALPNAPGVLTLTLGSTQRVGSIAIYNGYANRDDGTYTLRDAASNILGAWTISGTGGFTNNGVDSFWLTFNTPVTTNAFTITHGTIESSASYREIQIFSAIPEPATLGLLALGGLGLLGRRQRA